jgi:hypothetical protein
MTWVPQVCTLPTTEQPLRVAEFDALFARALQPVERLDATGLRLRLPAGDAMVSMARDLIGRETGCCSFFAFELHASPTGTDLVVRVPPSQVPVLDAMQQRVEAARTRGDA